MQRKSWRSSAAPALLLVWFSAMPAAAEEDRDYRLTPNGVEMRLSTNGCTVKDDFAVDVRNASASAVIIATRTRRDECKGNFPEGAWITFNWRDLGERLRSVARVIER